MHSFQKVSFEQGDVALSQSQKCGHTQNQQEQPSRPLNLQIQSAERSATDNDR